MIYKLLKFSFFLVIIITILWGFSNSYSSHNIDNIVHVVAIGVDKFTNEENNMKVSFQFVNMSGGGDSSSSSEASTVVTSISTTSINKAINLMNSYIGKELNFAHCKVIVFSEDFAKEGIRAEIGAFINNEEIRPNANIIISTSDANTYLKNSNPNIEKVVTNYYDTFELTSNFTGYSDDTTIGDFYNKLIHNAYGNTAILGRTFEKVSSEDNSKTGSASSQQNSQEDNSSSNEGTSSQSASPSGSGNSGSQNYSSESTSGQNSGGNNFQNDSGGASLEISGERGTQNVGIAVFKYDKYVGQLSETDSICHLLVTNNVDSFVLSVPMEDYPDNLLDLNVFPLKSSKISVDTSGEAPHIYVSVYCKSKILTVDENSNYENPKSLKYISNEAQKYLKKNIEAYLNKTSKDFETDIAGFSNHCLNKFLTINDWKNYNWNSKYKNATFTVNVEFDVVSSLLFSGNE